MQLIDGQLVHTASDLVRFLDCAHVVLLDREVAYGRRVRPDTADPVAAQLQARGSAVEQAFLTSLTEAGKDVAVIESPPAYSRAALERAASDTAGLLANGVDAVAQAVLFDGTWLGYADVLERVPKRSERLPERSEGADAADGAVTAKPTYEVVDTKLAGTVRAAAVVQVAQYSLQLAAVLGEMPRAMHIVLGDGRRETIATAHATAYVRRLRAQYLATVEQCRLPVATASDPTYPWRVPACRYCQWRSHCDATRNDDDHLTLVPGMRRDVAVKLAATSFGTRRALASASPAEIQTLSHTIRVPSPTIARLALGAALSAEATESGGANRAVVVRRSPVKPLRGLWRIPEESQHDLFIHIEEDPWQAGARLAFAAGVRGREEVGPPDVSIATERYGDGDLTHALYAAISEARAKAIASRASRSETPMHVFLFGAGTDQALRRLSSAHGVMEAELDEWLRDGVIVDLERVCREGIMTGRPYESLADLDAYTGYVHDPANASDADDPVDGEPPLLTFERWLARDVNAREGLRTHIRSTLARLVKLHAQLLVWQAELATVTGRPEDVEVVQTEGDAEKAAARAAAREEGRARGDALEAIAAAWEASRASEDSLSLSRSSYGGASYCNGGGGAGCVGATPGGVGEDGPSQTQAFEAHVPRGAASTRATRGEDDLPSMQPLDFAKEAHAVRLLRHLLEWHRREARTQWWEYFGHRQMDDSDRLEDTRALGGLTFVASSPLPKGREQREYTFPVGQEHAIAEGENADVANWDSGAVKVVALDNDAGTIALEASASTWASHPEPEGLAPAGPVRDEALRAAVARVAASVIAGWEADSRVPPMSGPGRYRAARRLLLGEVPRLRAAPGNDGARVGFEVGAYLVHPGESATDASIRIAREMAPGVLAIQGPPGTGKTYTAARMILALLRDGARVGVTANSHKAIGNVLLAVAKAAEASGEPGLVRGMQKATGEQASGAAGVASSGTNEIVERSLDPASGVNLFAGTAWLFAREAFDEALDVLFVDEAGQVSLANAVAVASCARRVILLGDPQQLSQPTNGEHPPGAEVSALEHLLGGAETMPPGRGIFLERSYRMHPSICEFVSTQFYDGRLISAEGCAEQRLTAGRTTDTPQPDSPLPSQGRGGGGVRPMLPGAGLRFVPVAHVGNRTQSREEAEAVVRVCGEVLGATWTTRDGSRPIGVEDILVVAPYNRQVDLLTRVVPSGVRVGTVDRFQGQEAPVVIYSLAASEASEASRGVEFLLDLHRMNVAVSRARGMVVLICSPQLLRTPCRSLAEVRQVNALCAFVEAADAREAGHV